MNLKKTALLLGGILIVAALWLRWWLQPERQIPRAQARLLSAVAHRDFDVLSALLAADYGDRWRQDRVAVIARSREVFGQFATLTIDREPRGLREESAHWFLAEKIRLTGLGGPLAMAARETVNALREPFVTEWHRRGWKPWDWELKSVAQPELELPE
ncbi:MAG: hypothetical protein ABI318_16630 [Chthoniobacteraceae bacterium]